MKRLACAPALALLFGALSLSATIACGTPGPEDTAAEPAAAEPAAPASPAADTTPADTAAVTPASTGAAPAAAPKPKYYRPVKGVAAIQIIETPAKQVGKEVVTVLKVRNMSSGRIDLLQVDQYWYDRSVKDVVTGTSEKWRKPFNPGDIIEITLKSPIKPNLYRHQLMFTHANGKIDVKKVDKFE